jgi:toxin YoeB
MSWVKDDAKIVKKIFDLIKDIQRTPFEGLGKPEPLKHEFKGFWSRRITEEHRLVYQVTDTELELVRCRSHYKMLNHLYSPGTLARSLAAASCSAFGKTWSAI